MHAYKYNQFCSVLTLKRGLCLQMMIPNKVKVYGSQHQLVLVPSSGNSYYEDSYFMDMTIRKSHLKSLDQPSERCASHTSKPKTSACIAQFLEEQIGCSLNIHGSISINNPLGTCNSTSQLNHLGNITRKLQDVDANTIYKNTGCLASCERNEYGAIEATPIQSQACGWYGQACDFSLRFKILDVSYKEEEQYYIYDYNSFLADVGGLLGLLLGWSIFGLVDMLENLLKRFKCGFLPK